MATKLYLHAANSSVAGTLPSSEQNTALTPTVNVDAQTINRSMDTNIGTSQATLVLNSTGTTTTTTYYFTRFVSLPFSSNITISAQTWTFNFATSESSGNANFPVTSGNKAIPITLYVWRPSTGAKVGDIFNGNSAITVDEVTGPASQSTTFSGSSLAVQAGDVICFEVIFQVTQQNGSSFVDTFYYDGTTETATEGLTTTSHAAFLNAATDTFAFAVGTIAMTQVVAANIANRFITKV